MLFFQQSFEPLLLSPPLFTDTTSLVCPETLLVKVPPKPEGKR
jgi:hypothetical protein